MSKSFSRASLAAIVVLLGAAGAKAQTPPSFAATFLGPAQGVSALSENGLVLGQVALGSATRGWVASASSPLQLLPLGPGDQSSWATDVNEQGLIVGAVSTSTSPEFFGRAAVWQPDGLGGYVLQELGMLPGHVGSIATAVNNLGDVVGYSNTGMFRYPVWFTSPAGVFDLNPFGVFDPQSINDQRQFCDRTGKRMDLDTMAVQNLGLPPGPPNYQATLGYAINEFGQVAGTAVLTTSTSCVYQAARYVDGPGWSVLSPCSPIAGATQINDLGDVIYKAFSIVNILHLEGIGEFNVQDLLSPSAAGWSVVTSFGMEINSARQMAVFATNAGTGQSGAVLLTPIQDCQADLGFGGPGPLRIMACGGDLSAGTSTDLTLVGAPAFGTAFLLVGLSGNPTAFKGGTLVPLPTLLLLGVSAGPAGTLIVPSIPGGFGPGSLFVQAARADAQQPKGFAFSNALRLDFLP